MFKRKQKEVYLVVGYAWENDAWTGSISYPMVSKHAVFSTYKKALAEIEAIKQEIYDEATDDGFEITQMEFTHQEIDETDTLEVVYESGLIENYIVYKRQIDF